MLGTQVTFRSGAFPATPDEDELINPGRHGRRLAEHLAAALPAHGFPVSGIVAEDWGWMVECVHAPFPLWIGCGNVDGEDAEYLCWLEPARPTLRRWFRKIDTRATVARLAAALDAILRAHPQVHDVRWEA